MVEFILGTFIVVLIRNKIVSNINSKAEKELYSVYHFKPLFKHWSIYPSLICVIIYLYLEYCVFRRNFWFIPYQQWFRIITIMSYVPLVYKYKLLESISKKHKSICFSPYLISLYLILLGTGLNLIAMAYNNWKMPIFPTMTYSTGYATTFIDNKHILGNMYTKLIPLTDIFDSGYMCFSLGDVFFRMFSSILIFFSIKKINKY
jgi:hypothetical protein